MSSTVTMAHGGGGRMTQLLLEQVFLPAFGDPALAARHDGAVLAAPSGRLAFTTDSFVVTPLEFPGGDIGSLAVCGTVNDLAMCGARPLYLSAGFILEEGLPVETLVRIVASMQRVAADAGVRVVTGDTKVVPRGHGDGVYVNTSGVGVLEHALAIGPAALRGGDVVLLSGDVGRHGVAIMASREGLAFESPLASDVGLLWDPVRALLAAGVEVHMLRDLTRGGLATALVETATASGLSIEIDEAEVPVDEAVQGACELLGLDPLYVANEGRFVACVPEPDAERALAALRACGGSQGALRIGRVTGAGSAPVSARTAIGTRRVLDLLSGEQLPRIC